MALATSDPPPDTSRLQGCLARSAVVIAILLAAAMIVVVYSRWFSFTEPRNVLEVAADEAAEGVEVRVERYTGDATPVVYTQTLSAGNRYAARFFLQQGRYRISGSRGERSVMLVDWFNVDQDQGVRLDITGRFPATSPTTAPARSR
ncbi:MAG TPA: hypothetical protein VK324_17695 [Tepidisphaeraceae bacterium]|nr:hypothetical protein [Tepidisphaeraceae bacterium]